MSGIDEILAGYENLRPGQEDFYRYLHQRPELSHQEHQTARSVAGRLRDDGFTVHEGIGGTGVTGVLANGSGPTVLLRCELDALPLRETTGAPFASTVTVKDAQGQEVPVDHACGHDMHMACMTGLATLMATRRDQWNGTLITLFQPAEETGEGAQEMVDDGLFTRIPVPDVALAQHLLPGIAGTVATGTGPFMSAADSIRVTVYGRSYSAVTRQRMLDAIGRIVRAECEASGSPKEPEFETIFTFPVTDNDAAATGQVATAFAAHFGDLAGEIPRQTVSEDFSKIPDAAHVPYCYWAIGFTDKQAYLTAEKAGTLDDLPTNHSPAFLPPQQPTLRTGTEALVAAALAWLAPH